MSSCLIAFGHGHFDVALGQLQGQASPPTETLQVMFDMLVVSVMSNGISSGDVEAIERLIAYFAQNSIYLDGCHVCLYRSSWYFGFSSAFQSHRPPTLQLSSRHHILCPYRQTNAGVLHHIALSITSFDVLREYGEDFSDLKFKRVLCKQMSGPVYANGRNLFHQALGLLKDDEVDGLSLFIFLAQTGLQPASDGELDELIAQAQSIRKDRRLKRLKGWFKKDQSSSQWMKAVIQVLEEYRTNGNNWGDLTSLLVKYFAR